MQLMLVTNLEAIAGVGWIGEYGQIALGAMEPAGLERAASLISAPRPRAQIGLYSLLSIVKFRTDAQPLTRRPS